MMNSAQTDFITGKTNNKKQDAIDLQFERTTDLS